MKYNLKNKVLIFVFLILVSLSSKSECAENATLVTQPAYHSMSFYVYKPANVPNEFFATFDGYLVYKDAQGVWNYASAEQSGIKKTAYVVGSVIPSVVKLKPWNTTISSVAPILGTDKTLTTIKPAGTRRKPDDVLSLELETPEILKIDVTPITRPTPKTQVKPKNTTSTPNAQVINKSQRIVYTPPEARLDLYSPGLYTPNAADWTQNSNFMAIGKWQNSIDRIGVLDKPTTPVAWKGDYPEVIYAWTGMQWRQMNAQGKHISALSTIRREIYGLTVHTNKLNAPRWTNDDSYVLSQYAIMWGYNWLGQLIIGREY